jgi:hypothetical protein
MNNLSTYIIEKLKLNKESVPEKDLYNIGDKCLFITYVRERRSSHPNFITIDVVEIKKKTQSHYICHYLTAYEFGKASDATQLHFKYDYTQPSKDYVFTWAYINPNREGVLIPYEYCEEVIEYIENNNCKISFYDLCRNKYKDSKYANLVIERYSGSPSLIWKNVTGLKSSSIRNIKNKLGL